MHLRLMSVVLMSALALAGSFCVTDANAAPKKIKVWTAQPEGDPVLEALKTGFKPVFEKETNGKYIVELYPAMSLGNSDSAFQGTQLGSIQVVVDSINNVAQFVPQLSAFDVPYMLSDEKKLERALASDAMKKLWGFAEKKGIHPVNIVLSTFRGFMSTKPIRTLEDAKGLKDRTSNSKYHISTIKALGMLPTPMAGSETLTSIQQGVIDAVDYELHAYVAQRIVDVAKNLVLSDHLPVLYMAYCGSEWWENLKPADKAAFTKAMDQYYEILNKLYKDRREQVIKTMEEKYGVTVTKLSDQEKARWIEASKAALKDFPNDIASLAEEIRAAGNAQ